MNDLKNLKYKIPQPLKEVTGSIASCIYQSDFCQYSSTDIATALVVACMENKSIEAVSNAPNGDTVLWRIKKGITIDGIKRLVNSQKPAKGMHITLIFDGHDKMFYGDKRTPGVVGTKPKNGSHRAFKYLAAYTTSEPHAVVDVLPLTDGSTTEPALQMVTEMASRYHIDMVIMDGEFYKAELIAELSRRKMDWACRRTNTGNIRELGVSYGNPLWYAQIVKRGDGTTINLGYWLYRYKGKDGDFYLASSIKTSPRKLRKIYKTRWSIETGFREINDVMAKTTTTDLLIRLFLYVVSCIIYNLWMKIRFRFSSVTIRLYDFVERCISNVRAQVIESRDLMNNMRKRFIRLRFFV